jgi:hypothetical protein
MELVEGKTLRELLSHGALRMAGSLADLSNLARDESNFELAHSLYRA